VPPTSSSVVLVVEDDQRDAERIRRILAGYGVAPRIFPRAFEAIAYLQQGAGKPEPAPPALVLLDWKLPGGGASVLETIRRADDLKVTPVVVLSGSSARADVEAAYSGHANAFVVKPADLDEYQATLTGICDLFLRIAESPYLQQANLEGA